MKDFNIESKKYERQVLVPMSNEERDIFFWTRHGPYAFLSNFYRAPITVDGKYYPTTEHFYQASKTLIPEEHLAVRVLATPKEAKFAGYHVALQEGWDDIKFEIMLQGLRAKFTQHLDLKEKLLATGVVGLHEDSPWDKYWGFVRGKGLDMLGKALMQIREELRNE